MAHRKVSSTEANRLNANLGDCLEQNRRLLLYVQSVRAVLEVFADRSNWLQKTNGDTEFVGCDAITGLQPWQLAQKALNKEV